MTTIAWDGKTLATDSQSNCGSMIATMSELKIFTAAIGEAWTAGGRNIVAVGMAGDAGAEHQFIDKMKDGLDYKSEFTEESDFSALAITDDSQCLIVYKGEGKAHATISHQSSPYAIGSGSQIAMAAMKCGNNAVDAVKIAIEIDINTGGDVQEFTVG